jgi:hypothetical protein
MTPAIAHALEALAAAIRSEEAAALERLAARREKNRMYMRKRRRGQNQPPPTGTRTVHKTASVEQNQTPCGQPVGPQVTPDLFESQNSPIPHTPLRKKEREVSKKESGGVVDARAREACLISPEAFALTDRVLDALKIDRNDPRSIGAAYHLQGWLTKGWRADLIQITIETVMARRAEAPGSLSYFEMPIARAHADAARPLPVASPSPFPVQPSGANPYAKQPGSISAALSRILAQCNNGSGNDTRNDVAGLLSQR